jgi:hypothetical protein
VKSRHPLLIGALAAVCSAAGLVYVAVKLVPEAHRLGRADREQREELERLTRTLEAERAEGDPSGLAASEDLRRAEDGARRLAERVAQTEALPPSASEASKREWAAEIAEKTPWPRARVESWMPPASVVPEVAALQMVTVRDMALTTAEAGIERLDFVLFPQESSARAQEILGDWLPTIGVRLEYKSTAEAHRKFLSGLLARRDRGPLYTIEELDVAGTGLSTPKTSQPKASETPVKGAASRPARLSVRLTLRRIVALPR